LLDQTLKKLICLHAFAPGPTNPCWRAIGYRGPRPTELVLRDAAAAGRPEKDFRRFFLDVEALSTGCAGAGAGGVSGADNSVSISAGEFDAVVVGSGCGGSVVIDRLTALGFRVLVLEKGAFVPRADLTGTEVDFDSLYVRTIVLLVQCRTVHKTESGSKVSSSLKPCHATR
jgi:hypothetical protein